MPTAAVLALAWLKKKLKPVFSVNIPMFHCIDNSALSNVCPWGCFTLSPYSCSVLGFPGGGIVSQLQLNQVLLQINIVLFYMWIVALTAFFNQVQWIKCHKCNTEKNSTVVAKWKKSCSFHYADNKLDLFPISFESLAVGPSLALCWY